MTDEVVMGTENLISKLRGLSAAVKGSALLHAVQAGGLVLQNGIKDRIKAVKLIRTRTLSRSIHMESAATDEQATLTIGTNLEYAAIHEFGGTVRAKRGKYLAIPVGSYRDSPTKHPRLKARKTSGGNLVLVSEGGQVQYVLKKSVDIPARPYMRPAYDELHDRAAKKTADAFKKLIDQAVQE